MMSIQSCWLVHVLGYQPLGDFGPGEKASWTTYATVSDVDTTANAVKASRGSIVVAPMTILDAGAGWRSSPTPARRKRPSAVARCRSSRSTRPGVGRIAVPNDPKVGCSRSSGLPRASQAPVDPTDIPRHAH